jgi:S1-C subfamily serine protease
MKLLALLATLAIAAPATAPSALPVAVATAAPTPFYIDGNIIVRIVCITGEGTGVGTGTIVSAHEIVTARHVIPDGAKCAAEQSPVVLDGDEPGEDLISIRMTATAALRALISCDGFKEGEPYVALGYALNSPKVVGQLLIGSNTTRNGGQTLFRGSVTPGMSGGPILDSRGRLAGVVNTYRKQCITIAGGTALKGSFLCRE